MALKERKSFCKTKTQSARTFYSITYVYTPRHTHNLLSQEWSTYICEKVCLKRKGFELRRISREISQTGRLQIPDRRSD